jgi:hypothetical protein
MPWPHAFRTAVRQAGWRLSWVLGLLFFFFTFYPSENVWLTQQFSQVSILHSILRLTRQAVFRKTGPNISYSCYSIFSSLPELLLLRIFSSVSRFFLFNETQRFESSRRRGYMR